MFALANGDELSRWKEEPFVMVMGEGRWIPPKIPKDAPILFDLEERYNVNIPNNKDSKRDSSRSSGRGDVEDNYEDELDPFMDMLRVLKLSRSEVCYSVPLYFLTNQLVLIQSHALARTRFAKR